MKKSWLILILLVVAGVAIVAVVRSRPSELLLTGIVTTDDVIVSPLIAGQLGEVRVKEGDVVTRNQIVATILPGELAADRAYFAHSAQGFTGQIEENEAAVRFQERQTTQQIRQAEATLASGAAQEAESQANLENAKRTLDRMEKLSETGSATKQDLDQARTGFAVAKSRLDATEKQIEAQRAALALAHAASEQVVGKRSALAASRQQQAAAGDQAEKATVRLGYAEIRAPIDGVVDVRAARAGEVVNPGQPIVTLINPDDLWVRVDVEESYMNRVRVGDELVVRLPWGEERKGKVFYRGVDAGFATQRDASRTKRDIKTFEVRLHVDNHDRRLAVGLTAYVVLVAD